MKDWISVEDRLPEKGGHRVLVWDYTHPDAQMGYNIDHLWFQADRVDGLYGVTHWMPLPEKPLTS